jgi:hypothetical protein
MGVLGGGTPLFAGLGTTPLGDEHEVLVGGRP